LDGILNGAGKLVGVGESLMGEEMAFQIAPIAFDVIEFWGIFWQPLDR